MAFFSELKCDRLDDRARLTLKRLFLFFRTEDLNKIVREVHRAAD